ANDPSSHTSQSLHLEDELGWTAVLVEPNPDLAHRAREERPEAKVFELACVSSDTVGEITFYIPISAKGEIHSHASIEKNIDDQQYAEHREIRVKSKSLNSILDEAGIDQIDLVSIDVEGAEMEVLAGLDLEKHRPYMILLEDKHVFLNKHRFLKKNGYSLVFRSCQNCWYVPVGSPRPDQSLGQKFSLFRRLYFSIWIKKTKLALKKRSLKPFASL
ncbi:MAG: FkbM family methyltransferase, partial [Paracoccaceae bacterium]